MTLFRAAQAALLLMIVAGTAAQAGGYGESNSIKALRALLQAKPDLWTALERAIAEARIDDNATVGAFEAHVNGIVRLVATSRDFESWSRGVVAEWGALPRFAGRRRLQGRGPGLLPVRRLGRHRPVREGCGRSHRRGRHPLSAGSGDRHRLGEAKVERG
ncbi:hypothetical protein EDC22_1172 [Tepidamorphus gemmatus]|uniref:Uncharacterized protein n=1 Tax=Tepidamorphus gemmatus TaxID=747076 RepID=A0A4R3LTP1_9HYPH|nr:hypothetical protein [Tepidamorphus gemmatus]TCT03811.1 hypothetical protein EDC22_1172 [Tepidamorphus gemmatus]